MSGQAQSVADITNKCRSAQSDGNLDLSSCNLKKIPDAVFFFFTEVQPESCNLSNNALTRLPAKIGTKFPLLRELIISDNKLSALPGSLSGMMNLTVLDMSQNSLSVFPAVIYSLVSLAELNIEGNMISRVDIGKLLESGRLERLKLRGNPLDVATLSEIREKQHQLAVCEYTESDEAMP